MKILRWLTLGAVALSFLASGAFAAEDKAAKQAEVQKKSHAALERFYKAKPELKDAAAKAPGYGIFTTYGFSFVVGGASAGLQLGASQTEVLIIFKTAAAMNNFVANGWTAGGAATASAGAGSATAGGGKGETEMGDAAVYTMTKNGLEVGLAAGASKFWKDKDLN